MQVYYYYYVISFEGLLDESKVNKTKRERRISFSPYSSSSSSFSKILPRQIEEEEEENISSGESSIHPSIHPSALTFIFYFCRLPFISSGIKKNTKIKNKLKGKLF